ncbi:hypothetical protein HMPREF9709_01203 [Helcococcus kunzii ATCC 51366]|uniref:Uncharacterized protein n=1 Tax=Helcococcus kunzii ATCC 51366 TaxID=883114 RepID=H3NPE2_9FIRM|nr:hypothetical protein HMPREF9709_01203 [Helcococcus kunzii ATCC 51366]
MSLLDYIGYILAGIVIFNIIFIIWAYWRYRK